MKATFIRGPVWEEAMNDQGWDVKFWLASLFEKIMKNMPDNNFKTATPHHSYKVSNDKACVTCDIAVLLDLYRSIIHESHLILIIIEWKISKDPIQSPFVQHLALESSGCHNMALIATTCERFRSIIDFLRSLPKDGNGEGPRDESWIT